MNAIVVNDINAVRKQIEEGADVNSEANYIKPLHAAVALGSEVIASLLIEAGADMNVRSLFYLEDERPLYPIFIAIERNNLPMLNLLLTEGANVNVSDGAYFPMYTPLHFAISLNKSLPYIKALVEAGADINAKTENNTTPLLMAELLDENSIKFILASGANPNSLNYNGTSLLHSAAKRNRVSVCKALIKAGAIIHARTSTGSTPLHYAVTASSKEAIKFLIISGSDINAKTVKGTTALHIATEVLNTPEDSTEIATILLTAGADPTLKDTSRGYMPIHYAVESGSIPIVEVLLEHGSQVNDETNNEDTPLWIAIEQNDIDMTRFLIEHDANVNHHNTSNVTIGVLAAHTTNVELLTLILDHPKFIKEAEIERGKTLLTYAKESVFTDEINKLIISKLATVELWRGWTKADAKAMDAIFESIQESREHPGNERYSFAPLDDITYCPICLAYTPRIGGPGETKGCMYMHHKCKTTAGDSYHHGLYNQYKSDDGNIWWCTICNRIAKGHQHYELAPPGLVGARLLPSTGSPFDKSCKPSQGGGGVEEKVRRFLRLREVAKELNEQVGTITNEQAIETLVEEMWLAGLTERRNAKRVANAMTRKALLPPSTNFPNVKVNAPNAERKYPNITRSANNRDALKPELSQTAKWDSIELDTLAPAVLFQHRTPDGTVIKHKRGTGDDGDDGEWLSFKTVKERIDYYIQNFGAEDFGQCPLQCGARLYPDEVQGIVSAEDLENYTKAFNRRFAAPIGGRRSRTKRSRLKQKGGAGAGLFHPLTDGKCVLPWKTLKNRR